MLLRFAVMATRQTNKHIDHVEKAISICQQAKETLQQTLLGTLEVHLESRGVSEAGKLFGSASEKLLPAYKQMVVEG